MFVCWFISELNKATLKSQPLLIPVLWYKVIVAYSKQKGWVKCFRNTNIVAFFCHAVTIFFSGLLLLIFLLSPLLVDRSLLMYEWGINFPLWSSCSLDCFGLFTSAFCMLDFIGIGSKSERHRLSVADGSPGYVSARIGHHVASSKRLF